MYTIPCVILMFLWTDFKDKLHPVCILQYIYPDDPLIKGQPHKNSKKGNCISSFNRCKKSVLTKVKEKTTSFSKPTSVFNKVFKECGGVLDASSCGSLPQTGMGRSTFEST